MSFTIKANIYGSIVARVLGMQVLNIAGLGSAHSNLLLRLMVKRLYQISLKKSAVCFFQNEYDQHYFQENNIITNSQSYLLPGSVDLTGFDAVLV